MISNVQQRSQLIGHRVDETQAGSSYLEAVVARINKAFDANTVDRVAQGTAADDPDGKAGATCQLRQKAPGPFGHDRQFRALDDGGQRPVVVTQQQNSACQPRPPAWRS